MSADFAAVGVMSSSWVFYSAMNLAYVLRTTKGISNHYQSKKKFGAGLYLVGIFPRLFKFVGVLVPLGAVAGCLGVISCAKCPVLLGIGIFPVLFILTIQYC